MLATRQQALVILLPVPATLQPAPAILQQVLATPQLALVSVTEIRIYSGKFLSDSFYN